jgi:hypothetical protein
MNGVVEFKGVGVPKKNFQQLKSIRTKT